VFDRIGDWPEWIFKYPLLQYQLNIDVSYFKFSLDLNHFMLSILPAGAPPDIARLVILRKIFDPVLAFDSFLEPFSRLKITSEM
jgi:hypothetical protein